MFFKFRAITGIEANSFKNVRKDLEKIRRDYFNIVEPIKADIKNYHIVAFHKFTFLFHQTLSKVLKLKSMHTTSELVDFIEALNSKNYNLAKTVKQKEDSLLKENDKKKFFALKSELENLIYEKNFFATIEKNIVRNNLIIELREFTDRIDEMEFSGKKITKEEVQEMFELSDNYVRTLTDTEHLDADLKLGITSYLLSEAKRYLSRFRKQKAPGRKRRINPVKASIIQKDQRKVFLPKFFGKGWSVNVAQRNGMKAVMEDDFNSVAVKVLKDVPQFLMQLRPDSHMPAQKKEKQKAGEEASVAPAADKSFEKDTLKEAQAGEPDNGSKTGTRTDVASAAEMEKKEEKDDSTRAEIPSKEKSAPKETKDEIKEDKDPLSEIISKYRSVESKASSSKIVIDEKKDNVSEILNKYRRYNNRASA